jgi:alkylhydroperoxidase family enzyme
MSGSFDDNLGELERRILDGSGVLDPEIRRAASDGRAPEGLAEYIGKVRLHAYEVTDADVKELLARGYSEDQVFELTVAAAYGAARRRLDVGLRALTARPDEVEPPARGGI